MFQKIDRSTAKDYGFLKLLFPGIVRINTKDSGIGSIGRIQHFTITEGFSSAMHPLYNDEALFYIIKGEGTHRDSLGNQVKLQTGIVLLIHAGKQIQHEFSVPSNQIFEGLEILLRPNKQNNDTSVLVDEIDEDPQVNEWRL